MNIGDFIKDRRLALGLSQDDIAQACGVNRSSVCMWEKGRISNMKIDKVARLASVLQVDPVSLVVGDREYDREVRNDDEELLLHLFRGLSDDGRRLMIERAHELSILYGKKSADASCVEAAGR